MKRSIFILPALMIQCFFLANSLSAEAKDDAAAIRELLLKLEHGYEQRDVEKYASIFGGEQYEYISDMTTPDDPSDDIHLRGAESERRAAARIFSVYENIELEVTDPEITVNGDSAQARNKIDILLVTFRKNNAAYYAASSNVFSLRKIKGEWKIVQWKQHEMSAKELSARRQGKLRDRGVESLIRDLGDDRLGVWTAAIGDLQKQRGTIVKRLIEALDDPNKKVRIRTIKVLCGIRDDDAVQSLINILKDENEDVDVRAAVASTLSECEGQEVDDALLAAARRGEPELRSAALLALAQRTRRRMDDIYQISSAELQHEDESMRESTAKSLGIIMSVSSVNILEQRFRDRKESENVRLAALEALKQIKSESVLHLLKDTLRARNEPIRIRLCAMRALAEAKDHQSLELMVSVAKDKEELFELRKEAISSLGALGNLEAVPPLIDMLGSPDVDLRREAVKSLEKLGDPRALMPLIKVVSNRDEDIFVRRLAGGGIVKIDQNTAFGPLVQIINDKTEIAPARRMAAEKLASYKDGRGIEVFARILKDKQQPWWLRRIAANCLSSIPASPCVEALKAASSDPDERVAVTARDALQKMDTSFSQ